MPVATKKLVKLLRESHYNEEEIDFLEDGFLNGFDIGYKGPPDRQSSADNLPFQEGVGNKTELWNKLMKEVKAKRVAGPFEKIPLESYIQSPIGLIPKGDGSQTRLIFHLSYDYKCEGLGSANRLTAAEKCKVKYKDLDFAIRYLQLFDSVQDELDDGNECDLRNNGNSSNSSTKLQHRRLSRKWKNEFDSNHQRKWKKTIFAGKSDLKSAFCILGLSRGSWMWLVMKAQDPITGEWRYFIDKCLPFGASISCSHFQHFSDALHHLIEWRTGTFNCITNYLDDFLFIAPTVLWCNHLIQEFLWLCKELNVPVSMEKTEWASPSALIISLGILLDGKNLILVIPNEKCVKAINMLQKMCNKRKVTVKELQSLCSYLNFLCKAIFPGRTFVRRMYLKFAKFIDLKKGWSWNDRKSEQNDFKRYVLKQHHHVWLDQEFKLDCNKWLEFLTNSNLLNVVNRPMVDILGIPETSETIGFYSDIQEPWVWLHSEFPLALGEVGNFIHWYLWSKHWIFGTFWSRSRNFDLGRNQWVVQ